MRWATGALLLWAATAAAHPHTSPAVWCDTEVRDREVICVLTIRRDVLGPWLALDLAQDLPELEDDLRRALVELFSVKNRVIVDGVAKVPRVRRIEVPEELEDPNKEEYLAVTLVYACERRPRQVKIRWRTFDGADWQKEPVVPGLVKSGPAVDVMAFSAEEPEYTWHSRDLRSPAPPRPVRTGPPPAPFPWLSLLLLALAAAGALLVRRRAWAGVAALGAGVVAALLAWPAAGERVILPSAEQARTVFEALHRNLYRAFDAGTEEEIYDLLAVSVDASLLQQVYLDIYESLILRDQGGAVTRVEQVDVVDGHVALPPPAEQGAAPHFDVFWKWNVHCAVSHWGHTHQRINTYAADYAVRHDGASWKIAAVTVREYERLDPDALR
ncbi:MAG: hypothetical protein ACYTEZ_11775 [Planctomycetota bacterium]